MINKIRLFILFFVICIVQCTPLTIQAAKYDYDLFGTNIYNVRAGSNYSLAGWGVVGCPEEIYGYSVKSIAADGFASWGNELGSAYIPKNCETVGGNAFLTLNPYNSVRYNYLSGATMPAKHFRYFYYYGFSGYTPLNNNNGNIRCATNRQDDPFIYNGTSQIPEAFGVYIDGENIGSFVDLPDDTTNVGTKTVNFPVVDVVYFVKSKASYGTTTYRIDPYNIANATLSGVETYIYDGMPKTPSISLYADNGIGMIHYFRTTFINNTNAGTASIKIQAEGSANFTGNFTKEFSILPANLSSSTIDGLNESYVYTGNEIAPEFSLNWNDRRLINGIDYQVFITDNINAGSAHMSIQGMGNFTGTLEATFTIVPVHITNVLISGFTEELPYQKDIPAIQNVLLSFNEILLKEGSDYQITYQNNEVPGISTMSIEGTGNFTGIISKKFIIIDKGSSSTTSIMASDQENSQMHTSTTTITNTKISNNTSNNQSTSKVAKSVTKKITISWKKVKRAKWYKVYFKKKIGKWHCIKKIHKSKKRSITKTLKKGTYYVRIRAYNSKSCKKIICQQTKKIIVR